MSFLIYIFDLDSFSEWSRNIYIYSMIEEWEGNQQILNY